MGNNIYISFLGTNDYLPCIYYPHESGIPQENRPSAVRFVQEVTISKICSDWKHDDKIFIFVTKDAKTKNWLNNGHKDRNEKVLERTGLEDCLKQLNLTTPVECVDIPDGHLEKDIWTIFDEIMQRMTPQATVYFDITHAFRSIPMLAVVVLNFAKIVKAVRLGGIFYGAFEVLGSFHEVKEMNVEKRLAPIVDLTSFDRMMDWVSAVDCFIKSGDAQWLSRLGESEARAVLSETKGEDRSQHSIKRLAVNLKEFTEAMSTCRGLSFPKVISDLKQSIADCQTANLQKPLLSVLDNLTAEVQAFNGSDPIVNGIQAARWCMRHNLIQQAYTILLEFLISYFVKAIGGDPHNFEDMTKREVAGQAINIYLNDRSREEWKAPASEHPDLVDIYKKIFDQKISLVQIYRHVNQLRNDLDHAGWNINPIKPAIFRKKLSEMIDIVEKEVCHG